jgi:adenine-specific DNA-methyltransferase
MTLEAEMGEEAWASRNSDTPVAFEKPKLGRRAVKVVTQLCDEVVKAFRVA